jgi:two-component system, cell cycle response regulator
MPRSVRAILGLLGAWLLAAELHGVGLHAIPTGPEKWVHLVAMGVGAGLCLVRAAVRREERTAWLLLGLGVLAWDLGELYFTAVLWSDASPPVPSLADAGYLSLPPLIIGGVILLARSRVRDLPRMLFVDGTIAGLAVGAVSAAIVFRPVLDSLHGLSISVITNFAYPVLDLVMLGLICGVMAIGGRRLDRRFAVIAAGVLCFWASDTIYLIKVAHGTWVSGGPYDPGWWVIALSVATAAWMDGGRRRDGRALGPARAAGRATIRTPVAFALVALGVLVAGAFAQITLPAVILGATALVSVMVRLVLTFRDHQTMLETSRGEATTDPLTGLGNRRALAAALERRLEDEPPQPMILALFDLDGFKNYNDSFGHSAGDALLQRLADALATVIAGRGGAYRMGGDEFCALLPGGDSGLTLLRAAHSVLAERGDGFSISASMGSVALPTETEDVSEALRLADQRMYAHKNSARRAGAAQEVKRALLSALAQRDPELSDHLDDVGRLATATAAALGCPASEVEAIGLGAELHDVGKVAIPEAILAKPGPLSDAEWALMRQHTVIGERIIASSPALAAVGGLVRSSHERFDGGGYPDGLAGERIPLGARVIAVCDSFHAMTSDRSYRQAMSDEVAFAELRAGAGTQFDPAVVAAFLRVRERTPPPEPGRRTADGAPAPGAPLDLAAE